MNVVVLIGRLTRDTELSYTPNTQTAVCRFDIAVDRPRGQGEDQNADFIRITAWGKQAETCDRYLSKGRQVAVRGRIQTGSYTNREGQKVYTTEVVAENVKFLGGGGGDGRAQAGPVQGGKHDQSPATARTGGGKQDSAMNDTGFDVYDDLPDTFQASDDDIPF